MPVSSKTLGVMIYVDNHPNMLQEFEWIYKSWIHSGNWTTSDLIVVHHPAIAHALPLHEEGIVGVPCLPFATPGSAFEGYHFMNSIGCLSGPHIDEIALRYPYLLRTDADVFLTKHLVDFRPSYPVHGRGHYHHSADFRETMVDFCRRHGVPHHNHFGCGHSLLARAHLVVHCCAGRSTGARCCCANSAMTRRTGERGRAGFAACRACMQRKSPHRRRVTTSSG